MAVYRVVKGKSIPVEYGSTIEGTIRKVVRCGVTFKKKDYFFITGDDGGDYFAGVDQVENVEWEKRPVYVYAGNRCRFCTAPPKKGEKGARAEKIHVLLKPNMKDGKIYVENINPRELRASPGHYTYL